MVYFFINIIIHGLISLLLLVLLISSFKVNQERKNKHGFSFFIPFFLSIFLLTQLLLFSTPRILDVSDVIRSNYSLVQGEVEHVGFLNNYLTVNGRNYYYNPLIYKPRIGDQLLFSVSSHSGFVYDMFVVSEE